MSVSTHTRDRSHPEYSVTDELPSDRQTANCYVQAPALHRPHGHQRRTGSPSKSHTRTHTQTQHTSQSRTQANVRASHRIQRGRRQRGDIYDSICSSSMGDVYSPYSVTSARPDVPIISPISMPSGFYSPFSSSGSQLRPQKRARSNQVTKRAEKKRRQDVARSAAKKSDMFIDLDGVCQDFLCVQKYKTNDTFSRRVNPKFFELEATNQPFAADVNLNLDVDLMASDSWALATLFDPIRKNTFVVEKDDAILDTAMLMDNEADDNEAERAMEKTEALFLRRTMLTSNNLYTDGSYYKLGNDAPEKAIYRVAPEQLSVDAIADRIELTFKRVRTVAPHPVKPDMKVKRVMPLLPNRDLWVHPYTQVKYDEAPTFPDNQQVPPMLVKASISPTITAFAVYQYTERDKAHSVDRSYVWENEGECSMVKEAEFRLLEWPTFGPNDAAVKPVYFSQVSNKVHLRKLTARIPKQRKMYESELFGSKAINVSWRNPTDEEKVQEAKAAYYMFDS